MRNAFLGRIVVAAIAVAMFAGAGVFAASEIPKGQMTVTASHEAGTSPSRMIDGSTDTGLYMGSGFTTGYIRFDLGGRYSVTQFDLYNDDTGWGIGGYNIYVTDSSLVGTAIQPSWGDPVATGTFVSDIAAIQTVALTPKKGLYLILFVKADHPWHVHPKEAWIYGDPAIEYIEPITITPVTETSAAVTWSTETATDGQVKYRELGEETWTTTTAVSATDHVHQLAGLTIGTTYEIVVINDGQEDNILLYGHMEIAKSQMTVTASHVAHTLEAVIDGNSTTHWYAGSPALTTWLRIDLGQRHDVRQVGALIYNDSSINVSWMNVYVTDSSSNVSTDWGDPVGSLTGPVADPTVREDIALTPDVGRFVILHMKFSSHHCAMKEVWVYGQPYLTPNFEFAAQTPAGNKQWTNSDTVDILSFSTIPSVGVTGYLISETPGEIPDIDTDPRWQATVPTSYKILADPGESGLNVTLIGWAKNSAGQLAPTTEQTIFYSVAEPAGYNVNVQAVLGSLAVVTWTTDVPSFSVVRYRIQGDTEWMSTDVEAAHTMNHSHRLTGLIMDMTYEIEIQNSQITEAPFTYEHVPGAGDWQDIDKGSWTAVASKELSAAGLAIDGNTATNWWAGSINEGTTMPQWIRINMGSRYDVRMVSVFQVDTPGSVVTRCEIYVTDSESSNLTDWGTMVGLTTEQLILGRQDVPVTPKEGRYIILRVWNTFHVSMREVWAAGLPVLNVEFTISDRTSGSTKFTNEQTVNVSSLNAVPFGDNTVTGYAVTETGTQPDPDTGNWQSADALTSYTFDQPIGDVTLWAWAKDSAGNVASLPATIYFSTAVPAISNVVITEVDAATADVTWDTDVAAWGSVKYKALGADEWVIVEETEANFAHSVRITGLQDGVIYAVVTVANEIEGNSSYYPATWPIEGDANLDCKVNILDLIFVRNRLNQSIATGDNWQADVNQDEKINILDLIYVRNKLNTSCP